LSAVLIESFASFREKRKELEKTPDVLERILRQGREKAHDVASATLREVKSAMKMS
jgi:hypothetical protein